MRIAFIVDMFPSLSETFILSQITGLRDLEHEIEIFSGCRPTDQQCHAEVREYDLLSHVHYHNDIPQNKLIRFLKGLLLVALWFPRHPVVVARALNGFRRGADAWSLHLLYKAAVFLEPGRFDIIQCHFGGNGNTGALLKELGIRGKLVTMFHGYDLRKGLSEGGHIYERLFVRGDCFLAVSRYSVGHLVALGADSAKVVHHPVGVDLKMFRSRWGNTLELNWERIRILTVARLFEEKGVSVGIRAVAALAASMPEADIEYRIVGDGPLMQDLSRLAADLNMQERITFLGAYDREKVITEFGTADLYLLPSKAEILPVVLMEALASGLPVVATSVGAVSEIVDNGKSGFLVDSEDAESMAERLRYLIDHRDEWRKMGQYGRESVAARYDNRRLDSELVNLYARLMAQ